MQHRSEWAAVQSVVEKLAFGIRPMSTSIVVEVSRGHFDGRAGSVSGGYPGPAIGLWARPDRCVGAGINRVCEGVCLTIDRGGKWWRGESVDDLVEYLRIYTDDSYPAIYIRQSVCESCQGTVFGLRGDQDEGAVRRTCRACHAKVFIGDSGEVWSDCSPKTCKCPCGSIGLQHRSGLRISR